MVHVFFVFVLCLVSTDGPCFVCLCSVSRVYGWSMFCLSLFWVSCLRMVHVLLALDTVQRQTKHGPSVDTRHRTKTNKTWTIRRHETQNKDDGPCFVCLCSVSGIYEWSMFCLSLFCVSCLRMVHVLFVFVLCLVSPDVPCFVCLCSQRQTKHGPSVDTRHRTKTNKTWTIRRHQTQNKDKQNMDHP
jgi:hypothetical protein